ncbi:sulfur reduction protein DsrE [Robertkochia solimangrovi]|uniref:DsrE family protein n=1 Tax=Robertkochia solimangrovi TaxID=2213046 RepID=UPI00117F83CC|nr:sulfur reduction protein DsrE [Robertkochia solimangrovi]TRZ42947.1 sulfur reduction protein DsrE [Robertkochia solimangrovi]
MKTFIYYSILSLFTLVLATESKAQQSDTGKENYVVLTKKIEQLKPIILSAVALKAENETDFGDFQVILCGSEIGGITQAEKIGPFLQAAEAAGVEIKACGFSLEKFKVDTSKIPAEIETVENGILYYLQLQKEGYYNISL